MCVKKIGFCLRTGRAGTSQVVWQQLPLNSVLTLRRRHKPKRMERGLSQQNKNRSSLYNHLFRFSSSLGKQIPQSSPKGFPHTHTQFIMTESYEDYESVRFFVPFHLICSYLYSGSDVFRIVLWLFLFLSFLFLRF